MRSVANLTLTFRISWALLQASATPLIYTWTVGDPSGFSDALVLCIDGMLGLVIVPQA